MEWIPFFTKSREQSSMSAFVYERLNIPFSFCYKYEGLHHRQDFVVLSRYAQKNTTAYPNPRIRANPSAVKPRG